VLAPFIPTLSRRFVTTDSFGILLGGAQAIFCPSPIILCLQQEAMAMSGASRRGRGGDKKRLRPGKVAFNKEVRLLPGETLATSPVTIVSCDLATAEHYAAIRADLISRGIVVGEADMQIAACALEHHCTVVTANIKDFERISGLQVHGAK